MKTNSWQTPDRTKETPKLPRYHKKIAVPPPLEQEIDPQTTR